MWNTPGIVTSHCSQHWLVCLMEQKNVITSCHSWVPRSPWHNHTYSLYHPLLVPNWFSRFSTISTFPSVLEALICIAHTGCWVDFSTGIYFDDGMGPRSSQYSGERKLLTSTLLMNHWITDLIWGNDSATHFIRYFCDSSCAGLTSLGLCGFNELLSHSSLEYHISSSMVPCPSGMNVPVMILLKLPGFSKVGSLTLKSKSRLSYANAHKPSLPRSLMILCCSFVRDLIMFTIDGMETHQPPWARTFMTHSGVLADYRKNPCTAWKVLHQGFVLLTMIKRITHVFWATGE